MTTQPSTRIITIAPSSRWVELRMGDIWEYRELLYFLARRDVKVRYKQTVVGAAWAIIQPFFQSFFTMVVFGLFFGRVAKIPSDGVPYSLFAYAPIVPWTSFANALATRSVQIARKARA
jgi:lipopolysaccharide transport system permease protein